MQPPASDTAEISDHGSAQTADVVSLADVRASAQLRASLTELVKALARQHAWEDHQASFNDSRTNTP